jgi:NhaA family Na+:H+ antiporter
LSGAETARRIAARVVAPIERFLQLEAASGIVLLVAAVIGLAWANSAWAGAYEAWLHAALPGIALFGHQVTTHFAIDDGLMTIFFLVVGLEIRRELHEGELSDAKKAALPVAAALGGMIVPALLYVALTDGPAVRRGWGTPVATDIAFAVGVLALLGKRVPPALRVLLLALAIIDDIGAILVIAVFYSEGVALSGLAIAAAGVLGVLVLQRLGVSRAVVYAAPAVALWAGFLSAGVHPSIAGVVLGLLTPVRPLPARQGAVRAGPAPVVRIQHALHPWVAYGIMPLFALANSGVSLGGFSTEEADPRAVFTGVLVGLLLGKPIGIVLASWATVKAGVCALPRGVTFRGVTLVGIAGGIGFTMAIFIANLAFSDAELLASAKMGVMAASALAALLGLALGRLLLPARRDPGAAATDLDAERSAER